MFSPSTTTTTTDTYAAPDRASRHPALSHTHRVWPTALLVFCTWAVSIAGLAALQHDCNHGDATLTQTPALGGTFNGLNDQCKSIFRFPWFIVSLEFVLIVILFMSLAMRRAYHMRVALVALFAIATVLYIYMTDQYLTGVNHLPMYSDGQPKHRARTLLAGSLMTAAANMFVILALGTSDEYARTGTAYASHTHTHIKNHNNNDVAIPMNNAGMVPVNAQHV